MRKESFLDPGPPFCGIPDNAGPPGYFGKQDPDNLSKVVPLDVYFKDHFTDGYYEFLQNLIEGGLLPVGKRSRKVPVPDTVRVTGARISDMRFSAAGSESVYVEAAVTASIYLSQNTPGGRVSDTVRQRYKVDGNLLLLEDRYELSLTDHAEIFRGWAQTGCRPLSNYLVPVIHFEELEAVAEQILRHYYPEALEKPVRVDPRVLSRRLGLKVRHTKITPDGSILGQVFFDDSPADPDLKGKTVLLDDDVIRRENGGLTDLTGLHESLHYLLHQLFYRGQKMCCADLPCLSQPVQVTVSKDSPFYWIEKHPNQLSARIAMPAEPTREKIRQLIRREEKKWPGQDDLFILERVICDMAGFYHVSRESARIRLMELGWHEAEGVLNYSDDRYVPNFMCDDVPPDGAKAPRKTYTICTEDAAAEYLRNAGFRKVLDAGRYIYLESHFCLNEPEYVCRKAGGGLRLTDYARHHIQECCLSFRIIYPDSRQYKYQTGTFQREVPSLKVHVTVFPEIDAEMEKGSGITTVQESPREMSRRVIKIRDASPSGCGATLSYHMDRLKLSEEALSELSGVSVKTISRIRSGRYHASQKTFLALCVGMHLEPALSDDLLAKAAHPLNGDDDQELYRFFLHEMYYLSIFQFNEILVRNGLPPLTQN